MAPFLPGTFTGYTAMSLFTLRCPYLHIDSVMTFLRPVSDRFNKSGRFALQHLEDLVHCKLLLTSMSVLIAKIMQTFTSGALEFPASSYVDSESIISLQPGHNKFLI